MWRKPHNDMYHANWHWDLTTQTHDIYSIVVSSSLQHRDPLCLHCQASFDVG